MFKGENWDACSGEVTVRKSALIELAEIAVSNARNQVEDYMRSINHNIETGWREKSNGNFRNEYHCNIGAKCDAERLKLYVEQYEKAVKAYVYLRMIDSKGENRDLKLID